MPCVVLSVFCLPSDRLRSSPPTTATDPRPSPYPPSHRRTLTPTLTTPTPPPPSRPWPPTPLPPPTSTTPPFPSLPTDTNPTPTHAHLRSTAWSRLSQSTSSHSSPLHLLPRLTVPLSGIVPPTHHALPLPHPCRALLLWTQRHHHPFPVPPRSPTQTLLPAPELCPLCDPALPVDSDRSLPRLHPPPDYTCPRRRQYFFTNPNLH
ncbi:hypothetical protein CesoFtcFv8_013421 [Champsocephalus esox]|uniref:Uncharacterized protein n=1 Tax=Champsocephalus esox TaxID=159716 RepID=A0AAN8BQZ9_9TELE|nr:hypothetical protein CesoFtcFv8_013421 [Champsocephalus esox]